MKKEKEIKTNLDGTNNKLQEHEDNFKKFGWAEQGGIALLRAEQTKSYMVGWIAALEWVMER